MAQLERNKQTVIAFISRAFNDKQPAVLKKRLTNAHTYS
jgi:predicted SnoaL-like aldol condensation-catalyzing enzyme